MNLQEKVFDAVAVTEIVVVQSGEGVFYGAVDGIGKGETSAGLGMKSTRNRNFEAGILTDDPVLVESAMNQFDSVWAGFKCKNCGRKKYCSDPVEGR